MVIVHDSHQINLSVRVVQDWQLAFLPCFWAGFKYYLY